MIVDGNQIFIEQNNVTWADVAKAVGLPEDVLRTYNRLMGTRELQAGDLIDVPVLPQGTDLVTVQAGALVFHNTAQMPQWEQVSQSDIGSQITNFDEETGRYIVQLEDGTYAALTAEELLTPSRIPFDPDQAVTDWMQLIALHQSWRLAPYSADLSDPDALSQAYRAAMTRELYILMNYIGAFEGTETLPTLEEFVQAFADTSMEELALLGTEVAALSMEQLNQEQGIINATVTFAELESRLGIREGIGLGNIDDLGILSLGYLASLDLDRQRQLVHDWDAEGDRRLLNELWGEIEQMPLNPVWGIPVAHIHAAFAGVHTRFTYQHQNMQALKEIIEQYETERATQQRLDAWSLPGEAEFALGFNDFADVGFVLRDFLVTGELDPTAALSIFPFLPYGLLGKVGRIAKRIPGIGSFSRVTGKYIGNVFDMVKRRFAQQSVAYPRKVNLPQRPVQHAFSRHGKAFGISGDWNTTNRIAFENAIQNHISNPHVEQIIGTFFDKPAIHYFDRSTKLWVATDMDGNFVAGWILSDAQVSYLDSIGNVR